MASITPIVAPGVHDSPRYAQAYKVEGVAALVFLSGQVAADAAGENVCLGDFRGQAQTVLSSVKALVEAAGSSLERIVKMNVFLTDVRHRPVFNEVRDALFGGRLPPLSVIEVAALMHPDWLIEIDVIAVAGQ